MLYSMMSIRNPFKPHVTMHSKFGLTQSSASSNIAGLPVGCPLSVFYAWGFGFLEFLCWASLSDRFFFSDERPSSENYGFGLWDSSSGGF